MLATMTNTHIANMLHLDDVLGLLIFAIVWIMLFECAHILVTLFRSGPLIGWAVGPLGVSMLFLHEPSAFYIWLNVLMPAVISGGVIYIGLFSALAPVMFPHSPLVEVLVIGGGVFLTSIVDFVNALRDLRYPLWGEARVLRSIQSLRASYASIHFTPFGRSYLYEHFNSNPTDLLQAM